MTASHTTSEDSTLTDKRYNKGRPALKEMPWGRQVEVIDPFGNRIRFCEAPNADI